MKSFSKLSSILLLGTTFGFFIKGWLTPEDLTIDLSDEEVHMYL